MKRIWIAIAFIAISAGLCAGEQIYITKIYNDINDIIAQAEEYENDEDIFNATAKISDYWDKHNDLLFAMIDSQSANELGQAILKLNPKSESYRQDLEELKTANRFFYRNQKVTIANIF